MGLAVSAVVAAALLFDSSFYRSAHGLLFTAPWALLGLCRAREVWHQADQRTRTIVLATILGLAGYVAGLILFRSSSPHGGLQWGARFALVFYPPLALMAGWRLEPGARRAQFMAIAGALILLGIGFQARGLYTIRHDKQVNAALRIYMSSGLKYSPARGNMC